MVIEVLHRGERGEAVFDYIPFAVNEGERHPKELHLFTLSTCSFCAEALEYLKSSSVSFKWVETDGLPFGIRRKLRNDFIRTFGKRMYYPTLVVDREKVLSGFEIDEWKEELEIEND